MTLWERSFPGTGCIIANSCEKGSWRGGEWGALEPAASMIESQLYAVQPWAVLISLGLLRSPLGNFQPSIFPNTSVEGHPFPLSAVLAVFHNFDI